MCQISISVRTVNLFLSMEIDLNKEDSTETSEFVNFSIREYVADIRSKDPKKCWPFGSLGNPDNNEVFSSYNTFLSSQNCLGDINGLDDTTECIVAPNSPKEELNNVEEIVCLKYIVESLGNDDNLGKIINNESSESTFIKVNYGQSRHENCVNEVAKIGHIVAVDNDEPGRNLLRRKPQKFRLLSDILNDPAGEFRAHCGITSPGNVNKRFVTETEEELDDNVTLAELFRKQKGIEVTDPTLKKKRKTMQVEELRVDQDIKSKHGLKDSTGNDLDVAQRIHSRKKTRIDDITMVKSKKDCGLPCSQKISRYMDVGNTEASKTSHEDSEMEAVMLLARRFNDDNPLTNERILSELKTNTACACVLKKIRENSNVSVPKLIMTKSSKTATKNYANTNFQAEGHPKGSTTSVFQAHIEVCFTKATGEVREAQNYATLVCSVNKNPADFSTPNAENMFMRGG